MTAIVDRTGRVLADPALERTLVATVIARGGDPLPKGIDLEVLHDMHAGHAWTAMLELRARGAEVSPAAVVTEVERTCGVGSSAAIAVSELIQINPAQDGLIDGWASALVRFDERRRAAIAEADPAEPSRWVTPLADFMGDEEPDDDDSSDWIIRDVVPRGEPCLLAGPPKAGKTGAAMDLAIAVALGRDWLDGAAVNTLGRPARVLVVALEDAERRLRRRVWELMRGRGMTPHDPTLRANLSITRLPVAVPSDTFRAFTLELRDWKPAFVVIDNLTRVMVGDPNSTRDAASFTLAWAGLCLDSGASVMLLHHTRKGAEGEREDRDPFGTIRGSGDLLAAARHAMVLRPFAIAGDSRLLGDLRARGNLDLTTANRALELVREERDGRMTARLVDRGDPATLRAEVNSDRRTAAAIAKRQQAASELEKRRRAAVELCHRDGHVSGRTLALATGTSVRTCDATLADLATTGVLARAGQRGYELAEPGPMEAR
jgi:hypothetical protein